MTLTRSQRVAQEAFARVRLQLQDDDLKRRKRYLAFARAFPTLIHTCGLAQASAFAMAKREVHRVVLDDLAHVLLGRADGEALHKAARGERTVATSPPPDLTAYLRLSRDALFASSWIKRYAEALLAGEEAE